MAAFPSVWHRIRPKLMVRALRVANPRRARRTDLVRLGSSYGGWWVPLDLLDEDSVCYSGGVGNDISFDRALIDRVGCTVIAMDPTPKAIAWLDGQDLPERFRFAAVGLSDREGELRFYEPEHPDAVSASALNIQDTSSYFVAPVKSVLDFMREYGHDRLDLIKLDIEGAEHATIRGMLHDGIRPRVVCVEYDPPEPLSWGIGTSRLLRRAGYDCVKVEDFNLTFVRRDAG